MAASTSATPCSTTRDAKGSERHRIQPLIAPGDRQHGVQAAPAVQAGRDAQPENAGFHHFNLILRCFFADPLEQWQFCHVKLISGKTKLLRSPAGRYFLAAAPVNLGTMSHPENPDLEKLRSVWSRAPRAASDGPSPKCCWSTEAQVAICGRRRKPSIARSLRIGGRDRR